MSPVIIPMLLSWVSDANQLGSITIQVLAMANIGKMINGTGFCNACSRIEEGDFLLPSTNGMAKASNTPVIVA